MSLSELDIRRCWATLKDMIADRGLDAPELLAISAEDMSAAAAGKLVFHLDAPSIRCRFVFELGARFKSSNIKKLLEKTDGIDTFMLIVREAPTSTALKGLEATAGKGKCIELFRLDELQYNVSRHQLVPPHIAVRDEATILSVLEKYQLRNRWHLPLILTSDPMARYLGLKHGELVRIDRPSPSAGSYTLYRCCMKA